MIVSPCCESKVNYRNGESYCKGCGAKALGFKGRKIMRQDKTIIQHMIEVIQNEGLNLTPWEEEFMESIYVRWRNYQNVTDRQEEIIERIYAERTP